MQYVDVEYSDCLKDETVPEAGSCGTAPVFLPDGRKEESLPKGPDTIQCSG